MLRKQWYVQCTYKGGTDKIDIVLIAKPVVKTSLLAAGTRPSIHLTNDEKRVSKKPPTLVYPGSQLQG